MILRSRHPKRSTTLYNVICGITDDNLSISERFEKARPFIFSFDYETPKEMNKAEFKKYFETMFLYKYNEQYLAFETFEQWQLKLFSKLLSVMPTYSIIIDNTIFNNTSLTDKTTTTTKSNNNSSNKTLNSEYPFNGLVSDDLKFANQGNRSETQGNNNSVTTVESGNTFVKTLEFDEKIKYLIDDLLNEFEKLFSFVLI